MIQDYIDMDTQEKIRYISESSNTSGYSTMSPGPGGPLMGNGNLSPESSIYSSPAQSPALALQSEFSNLNLPPNSPNSPLQQQRHYASLQSMYSPNNNNNGNKNGGNNNVRNFVAFGAGMLGGQLPQHNYSVAPLLTHQEMAVSAGGRGNASNGYTAQLRFIEHPVDKFRYRYKSEMHGTHGSLTGAKSKRTAKTFPQVELFNFQGQAVIRCSLFQVNRDSPHSHHLVIPKDDIDIVDPHDQTVSPERGYSAQFENMNIIHTAKRYIYEELLKKKSDRLRLELGREELSTKQMQELHKETKEEEKDMNLNKVRLCFEAFQVLPNNTWTRLTAPLFTGEIKNRKSAETGDLQICRLSIVSGSVMGGDELILLVKKVNKKNIKVRFFELNEDEEVVWDAYAMFRESDVHHQYAIVCQTPPYKDKDIDRAVEVCIELLRTLDDERSLPLSFRYKPREAVVSGKRRRTCSNVTMTSGSSGSSLSSFELPKPVQEQIAGQKAMAPSHNPPPATPFAAGGFGNPPTISEEFNKDQEIKNIMGSEIFRDLLNTNSEELSRLCGQNLSDLGIFDLNDLNYNGGGAGGATGGGGAGGRLEMDGVSSNSASLTDAKVKRIRKLLYEKETSRRVEDTDVNPFLQRIFQIFDDVRHNRSITVAKQALASKRVAAIFEEHAQQNENGDTLIHDIIATDNSKVRIKTFHILHFFGLADLLNHVLNGDHESGLHCACVHNRPLYIRPLVGMGCDPNIPDRQGNTALHVAIKEQHKKCVDSFLNIEGLQLDLSLQNDEGFTALHLAIRQNDINTVQQLLKHDRRAAFKGNRKDGNNALHMAVLQQNLPLVEAIMEGQNIAEIFKTRNNAGYTAIDLAQRFYLKLGKSILDYLVALRRQTFANAPTPMVKSEDPEPRASITSDQEALDLIKVKATKESTGEDEGEGGANTPTNESRNLEALLSDTKVFEELAELLEEKKKWTSVAKITKMHHLLCLWSSAAEMLKYVRCNAGNIEYSVFLSALAEVDPRASALLQAA